MSYSLRRRSVTSFVTAASCLKCCVSLRGQASPPDAGSGIWKGERKLPRCGGAPVLLWLCRVVREASSLTEPPAKSRSQSFCFLGCPCVSSSPLSTTTAPTAR